MENSFYNKNVRKIIFYSNNAFEKIFTKQIHNK